MEASNDDNLPPVDLYRPWHVRGRAAVKAYVATLPQEAREWLLALFVDDNLNLLAVDTIARGDLSSCPVPFARILCRGHALNATGFLLVHNHPSGDPTPSDTDLRLTRRLRHASEDLEMPLIDHLIVAGDEMISVGGF
jgi:DNA repair protein RadC